ncbi:MAG TPA: hypothetical protein VIK73_01500 [Limnochordales bacterium]
MPPRRMTARAADEPRLSAGLRAGWVEQTDAGSWAVAVTGSPGEAGVWRLQAHGAGPGSVPVGARAPVDWCGHSLEVGWERGDLAISAQWAQGRRYAGFPGPWRLVDGSVYGPSTRVRSVRVGWEGGGVQVLHGTGVPLWYTHNRQLEGDSWALGLQLGRAQIQAVASDTGDQRLHFVTRSPMEARQVEAALSLGTGWTGLAGAEWTTRLGISQRARLEDASLEVADGWALWLRARGIGRRPAWRLEASAVSPSFDSPLWGDDAPARDRVTLQGRWSWPRWAGSWGRWMEGEVGRRLSGGWAAGRLAAGGDWPIGIGRVAVGAGVQLDDERAALLGTGSLSYQVGGAGATVEVEGHAASWSGWIAWGPWRVEAAAWPSLGTTRLECGWSPDPSWGAWPVRGWRLVLKWRRDGDEPHLYGEAGWPVGGGASLGVRVGRWDEGRPEVFVPGPWPVLIMLAWETA